MSVVLIVGRFAFHWCLHLNGCCCDAEEVSGEIFSRFLSDACRHSIDQPLPSAKRRFHASRWSGLTSANVISFTPVRRFGNHMPHDSHPDDDSTAGNLRNTLFRTVARFGRQLARLFVAAWEVVRKWARKTNARSAGRQSESSTERPASGPNADEQIPPTSWIVHAGRAVAAWSAAALIRVGRYARQAVGYYISHRKAMLTYLYDYDPSLLDYGTRRREIRLSPDELPPDAHFDESGWTVQLPDCCVVSGELTDRGWNVEDREVEDVTWPVWIPVISFPVSLVLAFSFGSFVIIPATVLGGMLLGYRLRRKQNVHITFKRSAEYAQRVKTPRLRLFGKQLIIRTGNRKVRDRFLGIPIPGDIATPPPIEPGSVYAPISIAQETDAVITIDERPRMVMPSVEKMTPPERTSLDETAGYSNSQSEITTETKDADGTKANRPVSTDADTRPFSDQSADLPQPTASSDGRLPPLPPTDDELDDRSEAEPSGAAGIGLSPHDAASSGDAGGTNSGYRWGGHYIQPLSEADDTEASNRGGSDAVEADMPTRHPRESETIPLAADQDSDRMQLPEATRGEIFRSYYNREVVLPEAGHLTLMAAVASGLTVVLAWLLTGHAEIDAMTVPGAVLATVAMVWVFGWWRMYLGLMGASVAAIFVAEPFAESTRSFAEKVAGITTGNASLNGVLDLIAVYIELATATVARLVPYTQGDRRIILVAVAPFWGMSVWGLLRLYSYIVGRQLAICRHAALAEVKFTPPPTGLGSLKRFLDVLLTSAAFAGLIGFLAQFSAPAEARLIAPQIPIGQTGLIAAGITLLLYVPMGMTIVAITGTHRLSIVVGWIAHSLVDYILVIAFTLPLLLLAISLAAAAWVSAAGFSEAGRVGLTVALAWVAVQYPAAVLMKMMGLVARRNESKTYWLRDVSR